MTLKAGDPIPNFKEPKHFTKDAEVSVFVEWTFDGGVFDLKRNHATNGSNLTARWKTGTNVVWFESKHIFHQLLQILMKPINRTTKNAC